jgi:hypothetical protein
MNRKLILAATAVVGLSLSAPAFADDVDVDVDVSKTVSNSYSSRVGDITLTFTPSYTSTSRVNVTKVIADQDLDATNTNFGMHAVVDIDSEHGYDTGGNRVNGGAFAAFAGILNQSWNTGVNSNAQSANNLAVQGNTHFNN